MTTYWLFVAEYVLHIDKEKTSNITWWCVDRRCKNGDKAFLYMKSKGIVCNFEIIEIINPHYFCDSFGMGTAKIKIIKKYETPISATTLRKHREIKNEGFIKKNFQGKSFIIKNIETINVLESLTGT